MAQGTLPREYRTRAGSGAGAFLLMALIWGVGVLRMATADLLPIWCRVGLPVLMAGFIAFVAYARPRRFTVFDEKGIAVRGPLRVRRMAWGELHDIRAEVWPERTRTRMAAMAGAPRVSAYAYLADGKRVPLLCLDDREVEGVRTEVALIRSVWTGLRGPQWLPGPDAEARIARDAARRAWWTSGRATPVVALATVAVIVLGVVLLG